MVATSTGSFRILPSPRPPLGPQAAPGRVRLGCRPSHRRRCDPLRCSEVWRYASDPLLNKLENTVFGEMSSRDRTRDDLKPGGGHTRGHTKHQATTRERRRNAAHTPQPDRYALRGRTVGTSHAAGNLAHSRYGQAQAWEGCGRDKRVIHARPPQGCLRDRRQGSRCGVHAACARRTARKTGGEDRDHLQRLYGTQHSRHRGHLNGSFQRCLRCFSRRRARPVAAG